jgi:glycosyltransferase involved in cell wall biosynthesis
MKILHINHHDKLGGAAIAAFRLHNAMIAAGIDSKYFVQNRTINDRDDIYTVNIVERTINYPLNKICEKILAFSMHGINTLFSSFHFGIDITSRKEVKDADIIYLHWINDSFISWRILKKLLKTGKSVFWFMHDMFPITGGCHHALDCVKYKTYCRQCPCYAKHGILPDLSIGGFNRKFKIYRKFNNLAFISPSKWLYQCARESKLTLNNRIYHIPNLLDVSIYKPFDKKNARQFLSLHFNKKIIGFGAYSALTSPYKGWSYLKDALVILSKDSNKLKMEIEILVFGSSYNKELADPIPFPVRFLGQLYDDYSLVLAYNCLDVFVIPSLAENFPNTIIESLACNTPVVGFAVGGISDTVNDNTGYLAKYKDSKDLAHGIVQILCNQAYSTNKYIAKFLKDVVLRQHREIWKV